MTAAVKIQPQGFSVQYPKTQWRVSFVEDTAGKFRFLLSSENFKFELRDRYRYPNHDAARRAAHSFLELLKRLECSRMKLSVLAEIELMKRKTRLAIAKLCCKQQSALMTPVRSKNRASMFCGSRRVGF